MSLIKYKPGSSSEHVHFSGLGSALPTFLLDDLCASVSISRVALEMAGLFWRPLAEIHMQDS